MNILIAVHGFPPTHIAGAERVAERIAYWLTAKGHTVEVLAVERLNDPNYRLETEHNNNFTVHRVCYDAATTTPYPNSYDSPQLNAAVRQVMGQTRFDLVHIVSGYLLAVPVIRAAREAGIPIVLTLTEYWFMCARLNLLHVDNTLCSGPETPRKCAHCLAEDKRSYNFISKNASPLVELFWNSPSLQRLEAAVLERREALKHVLDDADVVISPSQFLIDKFAEFGYNTDDFVLIRHGLADSDNNLSPLPKSRRARSDTLRLGYTGQLKPHKGIDLIIEAVLPLLAAGHPLTLDLWGPDHEDAHYIQKLKHRTSDYPAVRWRGRYEKRDLNTILASLDTLIVPSRWYENSPSVILEAYAAGIPVIATRLGGMAEMIAHESNGLLFTLNDAHDLRNQIQRLICEPQLLSRLGADLPPVKTADDEVSEIFAQYQQLLASTK